MKPSPKEAMLGRLTPGRKLAQVLLKVKDSANAVADLQDRFSALGSVIKQSSFHSSPGEGTAVFNAFVELVDPDLTGEKLAAALRGSPFVLESYSAEGTSYGILDTLSFPITFGGKRLLYMNQKAISGVFHGIQTTFGTGGDFILFQAGSTYGKEFEEALIGSVGKETLRGNFGYTINLLSASGWGEPEIDAPGPEGPSGSVKLEKCFECEGTASTRPVCSFVRGVLAGSIQTLLEAPLEVDETECIAKGDDVCRFVIKRL